MSLNPRWKITGTTDGGRANQMGGRDTEKINRRYNAELDVDDVSINSKTEYADAKLFFRNRSSTWGLRNRFPILSGVSDHVDLNWPALTVSDTVAYLKSIGEFENKTLDIRKNTVKGAGVAAATGKKTGQIVCERQLGATAGDGILRGHIDRPGQPVFVEAVAPSGDGWEYSTGLTANTVTGIEWPGTFMRRQFNSRFKAKVSIPTSTSNTRLYVGMSTDITIPNTNTPLANTDSGVIVGWRTTPADTEFQVFHNGGASGGATTPTVVDTNILKTTNVITIEVLCRNQFPHVEVTISNVIDALGNETVLYTNQFTSNIPLESASMAPTVTLQNSDAADHKFRIWGIDADKTM